LADVPMRIKSAKAARIRRMREPLSMWKRLRQW
jgi:hypothetical protein